LPGSLIRVIAIDTRAIHKACLLTIKKVYKINLTGSQILK
jgi:hypothetical protein